MRALFECVPDRDNRVVLSDELDALGRPRARVHWRLTGMDLRSIQRVHELFDQALQRAALGRVELTLNGSSSWSEATEGAKHHMGTTRMHVDPRQGVVDADARVHGTDNLYVAGSSVFPTGGFANPTLTIVALAVRLAEHLKRAALQGRRPPATYC
jgi:choline dehydrogenase-like flavoprotein